MRWWSLGLGCVLMGCGGLPAPATLGDPEVTLDTAHCPGPYPTFEYDTDLERGWVIQWMGWWDYQSSDELPCDRTCSAWVEMHDSLVYQVMSVDACTLEFTQRVDVEEPGDFHEIVGHLACTATVLQECE